MARATPVPVPVLPIIGREGDIETVLHLLDRSRSVTLLGPGGVGKTRLAVEVALRWSSARSLPAYFVDLTKVDDPASVPILIAQVGLHRTSATDAMQLLDEAFRGATMLVVLDNFEHVVDAGQIVGRMVRWSPGAHVLSTSRARLQISDEQVVDIAPLEVEPDPASRPGVYSYSDAVAFFEQVALGVDGRFALADHLTDVSEICRTLEGLPLAIKLAAGHVRTLPPGLLRARLSARLASASGSARDTPARQQTIQATIDWSLQLLGDAERLLFTRLGVFAAPFALEAVEEVCGEPGFDVVDALARLGDQSLVHRMRGPGASRGSGCWSCSTNGPTSCSAVRRSNDPATPRDLRRGSAGDARRATLDKLADRWIDLLSDAWPEIRRAHDWAKPMATRVRGPITA